MIEVTVLVQPVDGELRGERAVRMYSWPIAPRAGEMLQLQENMFACVAQVWHFFEEGGANVILRVPLQRSDFERLCADGSWCVADTKRTRKVKKEK